MSITKGAWAASKGVWFRKGGRRAGDADGICGSGAGRPGGDEWGADGRGGDSPGVCGWGEVDGGEAMHGSGCGEECVAAVSLPRGGSGGTGCACCAEGRGGGSVSVSRETKSAPAQGAVPDAPGSGSGAGKAPGSGKSAGDQFPFPGDTTKAPDPLPGVGRTAGGDAGSSSSSSNSSGDANPDAGSNPADGKPGLKDEGTTGESARSRRRRLRPMAQKTLSDDERVDEDLSVAHFYQQSGNLMGAYLRSKDAVKTEPNEPDGHLALAEVAQKMGKKDEAVAEYTAYLKLDPDGDGAKAAKKALEKMAH